MSTVRRILVLLAAAALLSSACSDYTTPYAAKVNGRRVTVDKLNRELEAVKGNKAYLEAVSRGTSVLGAGEDTFGSAFVAETLTRRIYFELVHQEVVERGLRVTPDAVQRARDSFSEGENATVFKDFPADFLDEVAYFTAEVEVLQENLRTDITDQQVQDFYRENPQFFQQYCARQILTGGFPGDAPPPADQEAAARAAADDIKRRIEGGQDFAAIAGAESKDEATAAQGGDLGCVPNNAFPPEAQAAVEAAQPGQVVGPIRTDRGFYVIQVQRSTTQPLEEVAEQIRSFLQQQAGDALTTFLQEAIAEAEIEVNPRYGRFDREAEQPRVVPPEAPATETTTAPEDGAPLQ